MREASEWGMSGRVAGESGGVVICETVVLAVEIAEKSRIAVQAQKQAVNVGTFPGLYSFSPAFILL